MFGILLERVMEGELVLLLGVVLGEPRSLGRTRFPTTCTKHFYFTLTE